MFKCTNCQEPHCKAENRQCETCRGKSANCNRKKYLERKAAGLCPKCGRRDESRPGAYCSSCHAKQTEAKLARKKKKEEQK